MEAAFLSVKELMERMKTDEQLSVIEAIKSGLRTYEKGDWKNGGPDWGNETPPRRWMPSPFGREIRKIDTDKIGDIDISNVVFRTEDVQDFESENDSSPINKVTMMAHQRLKRDYAKLKKRLEKNEEMTTFMLCHIEKMTKDNFVDMGKERFPDFTKQNFKALWKRYHDIKKTDKKDT